MHATCPTSVRFDCGRYECGVQARRSGMPKLTFGRAILRGGRKTRLGGTPGRGTARVGIRTRRGRTRIRCGPAPGCLESVYTEVDRCDDAGMSRSVGTTLTTDGEVLRAEEMVPAGRSVVVGRRARSARAARWWPTSRPEQPVGEHADRHMAARADRCRQPARASPVFKPRRPRGLRSARPRRGPGATWCR